MNLIRNPFNVGSPWWYYIEGALTVNVMTFMILIFMFISYQQRGNVCLSIWILFVIHVVMAFLLWIMALKHDMTDHPEMFREATDWCPIVKYDICPECGAENYPSAEHCCDCGIDRKRQVTR